MSQATHIVSILPGDYKIPTLNQGIEIPVVKGSFQCDWDVVEEDLPVEWLEKTRRLIRNMCDSSGLCAVTGKYLPLGIDNKNIANIKEVQKMTPILPTIDTVVAKYLETRELLSRRQKELDAELAPLKDFQKKREQWLQSEMAKIGAKNVKTPHGTVYQTTTESVTMADWDSFYKYVQDTGKIELLTHAVNKTAALEIMGEDRDQPLPPGVNYTAIRTVNVRKT
jgi:hypothetical protein